MIPSPIEPPTTHSTSPLLMFVAHIVFAKVVLFASKKRFATPFPMEK
jgi:hypothetical protein